MTLAHDNVKIEVTRRSYGILLMIEDRFGVRTYHEGPHDPTQPEIDERIAMHVHFSQKVTRRN